MFYVLVDGVVRWKSKTLGGAAGWATGFGQGMIVEWVHGEDEVSDSARTLAGHADDDDDDEDDSDDHDDDSDDDSGPGSDDSGGGLEVDAEHEEEEDPRAVAYTVRDKLTNKVLLKSPVAHQAAQLHIQRKKDTRIFEFREDGTEIELDIIPWKNPKKITRRKSE